MPLLSLAIPLVRSGAPLPFVLNPSDARAHRSEFAIEMGPIKNQMRPMSPTSPTSHAITGGVEPLRTKHFRQAVFDCQPVPIGTYFDNVLAELVTPQTASCVRQYESNAALRTALDEILSFHPQAASFSLKKHVETLSLPSLLRDEPEYAAGTLTALCYDVGAHSIEIGRIRFPQLERPGEAEFLFAGESELAFLHEGNPHAALIRNDHASILDFHYRAAGMEGHTSLPPVRNVNAGQDDMRLSDFTAHLARCRRHTDPGRSPSHGRHSREAPMRRSPLDRMQTGPCSIL